MLRRSTITVRPRCTAVNSSSTRKVSQFSENNSICNESNKERRRAFTRRYSSIPSINKSRTTAKQQRRRSEMLSSIDVMKQNENGLSPISEKNTTVGSVLSAHTKQFSKRTSLIPVVDERKRTNHIPLVAERKRTSLIPLADARMNVVPQIVLSPPSNNGSDDLNIDRESHEENLLTESFTIDKKDSHTCVKCSSRVTKDSETNTTDVNEAHQIYLREVKNKMEKALLDQQRLEKEFQVITQDYFQKGKKIMEEYKSTFNFMDHFINEFKHVLTLPVNSTQIEKKELEGVKPEPALKNCKKVCKEYRFLGTPLPKKNKKLMHSFSDPSSPTNKSPTSYEASFYSVDSVISPFTNIVGELERPSLLPMTPGSRNNFTNLKVSLNEQLDLLFQ
ncbi:hypothetical protein Avbf_15364 [Armadillidium vulgare]|nr:hypothetical protein Avbf_15364 [Armadillidium vulgare]